ncbi:hypothetical protein ECC02_011646 [Trypanosoma cruzi]|uniref:Uncharacterized protein n=1 Tax=Trypanosoma cruzi TaxID=5693 RepID=A0A7J6XNV3_TRYCR|nr:hypothetical protein ECC02_011646 [Trypanosoma cruzi]
MFGRRNMARTNDLWEEMCTATRRKKMLRDDHHKTGVKLFFLLARGRPATWSVGRIIFLASLRFLFITPRFFCGPAKGDLQEISARRPCRRRKSGFPLEKRHFLNLFWAGSSCRFNATLFCGFDACVSERFDLCSQPTRMWCARRREGACQPFYCLPRCGCRRCLLLFLRSCGFLTRCFGEGVAALIVHGILILVSRSGDIEREGLLPFCFICPLCLTASSTQACSSAPQLVLAGLLTVVTGSCMRQLFSASFQCRIFLLIDGRHSVRRATLIGLCGIARQRHRRNQADFFTYLNAVLCARIFHMFCWALKQRGVRNHACVEFFLPCEWRATPRGCHFDSAELLCLFAGLAGKFHAATYCWCVLNCHSMRSKVFQRVRGLLGLCALWFCLLLCAGTQHLSGGKMERGDAWPRPAYRSVHGGVVHIAVLTLRCDCGLLRGNGGGWRGVLSCIGTVGLCILFSL